MTPPAVDVDIWLGPAGPAQAHAWQHLWRLLLAPAAETAQPETPPAERGGQADG
jgi:hypothetical protein